MLRSMTVRETSRARERMVMGHHPRGWILRPRTSPDRVTAITQAYLKGEKVDPARGNGRPLRFPLPLVPERSARIR